MFYAPSTKFYLQDKRDGKPWLTKLPFPVHVVEKVVATDRWRKTRFATTYSYHHGYFDGVEREFRGPTALTYRMIKRCTSRRLKPSAGFTPGLPLIESAFCRNSNRNILYHLVLTKINYLMWNCNQG